MAVHLDLDWLLAHTRADVCLLPEKQKDAGKHDHGTICTCRVAAVEVKDAKLVRRRGSNAGGKREGGGGGAREVSDGYGAESDLMLQVVDCELVAMSDNDSAESCVLCVCSLCCVCVCVCVACACV